MVDSIWMSLFRNAYFPKWQTESSYQSKLELGEDIIKEVRLSKESFFLIFIKAKINKKLPFLTN